MTVRGRKIVIAWNGERTLRFGIHREELFTAVGCWPLLIGIESRFSAERRARIAEWYRNLH